MALIDEINEKSKEISTDKYSASIGEIITMYKEGDLDIHPDFQRFYRWELPQQSRLIESFLLNFPVPPIFVNQREDGVWDVVDGLQRLSTILQFVGIYKDSEEKQLPPLRLCATKMLPSLEGKYFESENEEDSFTADERRFLKRTRLDFIILKKESDSVGKYEVFQRLNTGGSSLSDQEVRNCLIVMSSAEKFKKIDELSKYSSFTNSLRLGDRLVKERFDLELVTRFLCLRNESIDNIKKAKDFGEYLDDRIVSIINDETYNWEEETSIFNKTFDYIYHELGDNAFLKYDLDSKKFVGGFYTSVFEMIAISIGRHGGEKVGGSLTEKVINLWKKINEKELSWKGYNASGRLERTLSLGDSLYE